MESERRMMNNRWRKWTNKGNLISSKTYEINTEVMIETSECMFPVEVSHEDYRCYATQSFRKGKKHYATKRTY